MVQRAVPFAGLYIPAALQRLGNVAFGLSYRFFQRSAQSQIGGNRRRQGAARTVRIGRSHRRAFETKRFYRAGRRRQNAANSV